MNDVSIKTLFSFVLYFFCFGIKKLFNSFIFSFSVFLLLLSLLLVFVVDGAASGDEQQQVRLKKTFISMTDVNNII